MALIGISTEEVGQCTLRCKVTPFAPAPGILLCDCGYIAQTHSLGSPCCRPVLTHIPLGMQGAPAQMAAGCQFWIFLVNILGVVVAPGPKQPMVCSCQDQCWAPHSVPAEISMICFLPHECHDVQSLAGLCQAKAQQVPSAWLSCALLRTTLFFLRPQL